LKGVDKAILLALATPLAYLIAFQYDRGYLGVFGIPETFVDVSLRDLLIAVGAFASAALMFYVVLDVCLIFLPKRSPSRIQRRVIPLILFAMLVLLLLRASDARWTIWMIALALIAVLVFFLVALPILGRDNTAQESSSESKKPAQRDPYAHKGVIPELLRRGVEPSLVVGMIALIAGYWISDVAGEGRAIMQTSFLVHQADDGTVCAVIRVRDEGLLCADFDMETRQLTGDYHFLKPEAVTLSRRETGRLKPPDLTKLPALPIGAQRRATAAATARAWAPACHRRPSPACRPAL
jgi:hypothetical protein